MNGQLRPDEATEALAEIGRQQQKVIEAILVPAWYWWVVAVGMVAIGAAVDTRSATVLGVVIPVAVVVIAGLSAAMIFGAYRRVRVRSDELLGGRGALAIVGFVWLIVGLTLGIAFGLRAAGAPLPATIATLAGGAALVIGGPWLMRTLRGIMLGNRAGRPW
jgi:hypothetical protein